MAKENNSAEEFAMDPCLNDKMNANVKLAASVAKMPRWTESSFARR
jgi:hypothetical protein